MTTEAPLAAPPESLPLPMPPAASAPDAAFMNWCSGIWLGCLTYVSDSQEFLAAAHAQTKLDSRLVLSTSSQSTVHIEDFMGRSLWQGDSSICFPALQDALSLQLQCPGLAQLRMLRDGSIPGQTILNWLHNMRHLATWQQRRIWIKANPQAAKQQRPQHTPVGEPKKKLSVEELMARMLKGTGA